MLPNKAIFKETIPVILCKKDIQTVTKLQHKLFYPLQSVYSNTILISKFRHLPTCGDLGFRVTFFMLRDLIYGENIF